MAGHSCMHYVRLFSSVIGVFVGLLASATFFFAYHFVLASVWAFTSAVFAAVCMKLHILYHRNVLQAWHSSETLSDIRKLGFFVFVISFACTVWYIFIGAYHHRGMMPIEDSPYITAVWSFMTGKWGLALWMISRMYSGIISSGTLPILLGE